MSQLSGWFRADALRRQAKAATTEAGRLWFTLNLAAGLGGPLPDGLLDRYAAACERAERLYLEWRTAL